MKVIIIKKCSDGNVDDIINVKPGYASNFLFSKNIAVPFNKNTQKALKKRLKIKEANNIEEKKKSLDLKDKIEKIELVYKLKARLNHVHHSITSKKIISDLSTKDIIIDKYMIKTHQINQLGDHVVKIVLSQGVIAKLKIKIMNESGNDE